MKSAKPRILTINGGSSSIKFALFEAGDSLRRILEGGIERIGLPESTLRVKGLELADNFSRPVTAPDHPVAVGALMDWIEERLGGGALTAVGHRVVHGGPKYSKPHRITAEMITDLHKISPFDPEHMPEEILLIEAFQRRFPELPQVACFDTAFHHDLPRVAQLLPIPRRYEAQGVRRYGFHGLSYEFLMGELAGTDAAQGRVILAHLGNGASLAAVRDGKPVDTSMGFTPTAGVPWFVEQVFGYQALDDELKLLAAKYGPPKGRTMLVERDGEIIAAGAYRRTSDTVCELKRLFVSDRGRGLGLGRKVTAALMDAARADGFEIMQLDTSDRMAEATALYLSMGFERIAPYQTYPVALMPHLVFMETRLQP